MPPRQQPISPTKRKPAYPISPALRDYLVRYHRDLELPVLYRDLMHFRESIPLEGPDGDPGKDIVLGINPPPKLPKAFQPPAQPGA